MGEIDALSEQAMTKTLVSHSIQQEQEALHAPSSFPSSFLLLLTCEESRGISFNGLMKQ